MASDSAETDFVQQMESLKQLQEQTQTLMNCKAMLLQTTETLETKTNVLDELTAERHRLLTEKRLLLDMIQGVQRDIETITDMEGALGRECEALQKNVHRIRNEDYEPLHDTVNKARTAKGLTKLPHAQQDMEAAMARKLKERRENWQDTAGPSKRASPPQQRSTKAKKRRH
ncbi:hypothetical protein BC941DRAFT_443119 [Chlamydoabsidia padenii]|nr:hypothetical protein BC941DRAFT_443119 [Chlamydoabsidia padenii]